MYISQLKLFLSFGRFFLQEQKRFLTHISDNHIKFPPKKINRQENNSNKHFQNNLTKPGFNISVPSQFLFNQLQSKDQIDKNLVKNQLKNRVNSIKYDGNSQIQDRLVISQLNSIKAYTISVFDGHGGSLLANYASKKITPLMETFVSKHKNQQKYKQNKDKLISDCLSQTYKSIQNNFYQDVYKQQIMLQNKRVKNIGSCALTVLIHDNKIYVANSGDSQAIIVSRYLQNIQYIKLNQRLSVNNPTQRQRLYSQFPDDQDIIVQQIKGCYYLKGRLQPTRSLGDYHLKKAQHFKGKGKFRGPYIKYQPQINIFPIKKSYKNIVIASDGIWDIMNKWQVSRICLQNQPHQHLLNETLKKVAQMHKKSEQDIKNLFPGQRRNYHDDISLAIVDLENQIDDK